MENEALIGEYRLKGALGKGGMSEVYEAESVRSGGRYALKIFTRAGQSGDLRERFENEARILAKLNHPSIVRVLDFGIDAASDRPYFVMDLVRDEKGRSRTLADVEPGTVDEETVGRWYDELRQALAFIHSHGVVHRDLKLENVLIGMDGHTVLADFGVSKVFVPEDGGERVVDSVRTIMKLKDGQRLVMGSIGYMAPELELGAEANERSDYFALGVIVYRLLTGRWFDSKVDSFKDLDSYDPVWGEIIPRLLHVNPAARECLPYGSRVRAARERALFACETELDRARATAFRMRMAAVVTGGAALALGATLLMSIMTESQLPRLESVLPTETMLSKTEADDVIYARNELLGEVYDAYATGDERLFMEFLEGLKRENEGDEEKLRLIRRIEEAVSR